MVATTTLLMVVGGLIAVIALMRKQSKQRMTLRNIGFVVLGAGALLLAVPSIGTSLGIPVDIALPTLTAAPSPTAPAVVPAGGCGPGSIEDATVTLSAQDAYTASATGGTHRYRVNGAPASTVSDGGTFTASAGDVIEVLWYNGATSTYFSARDTYTVPCNQGAPIFSTELVADGTQVIEVFNEEGNLIDSSGENETLGAGDVVTLSANIKGAFQTGLPYGGVMVVEYNTTAYDDVIADFGGSKVSVPDFYTVSSTGNIARAYSIPAIASNDILRGSMVLDADDTINPAVDNADVTITLYKSNYFINEDTGGSFDGPAVMDEDSAQIYSTTATFTLNTD